MNDGKLNCSACGGHQTMTAQQVSKMSPVVQLIGWIIAIPSILGVVCALGLFLLGIVGAATADDAAVGGAAVFASGSTAVCIGISSLVSGLIGYLLIMKKKVWKCTQCGYHIDRD